MKKFSSFLLVVPLLCRVMPRLRGALFVSLAVALLLPPLPPLFGRAAGVHALFNLDTTTGGPFPSDRFTVVDASQNTRLRVNLPKPDCQARPSDCEDLDVLNTLDGFNMQPRLSIPFDGRIDVNSVSSQTVFLISLGDTLDLRDHGGRRVGINQVVLDSATNALQVWSDEQLDQHTRYGLIVSRGVRDTSGAPVEATDAFRRFLATGSGDYWTELVEAVRAAAQTGTPESDIVSASVFTTQSATAILEKIRDQIKAATPAPANFRLGPGGSRTVSNLNQVTGITWNQQTGDNPPKFTTAQVSLSPLQIIPGAVGQIAFGKYVSPDYMVHPGEYILPVGTRTGRPVALAMNEIHFNLYLPSSPKPAAGWPVAIFGTGGTNSKENNVVNVVATMASHGIATIAINAVGRGFGALSTLTVNRTGGGPATFPAGGRGIDQNRNGQIEAGEGGSAAPPRILIQNRDCILQTSADLIQLVRVIEVGMDMDGDGRADLDPSRICYFSNSFGSWCGMALAAVEPDVRAAVFGVPSGVGADVFRLGGSRSGAGNLFAARRPSLINSPGITLLSGVAVTAPYFDENMPLRSGTPMTVRLEGGTSREIRSPVVNTVAGAMQIQEWFDHLCWANQAVNPAAYAPHLRKNPLPGMLARQVLFYFARGDQTDSNPTNTMLLRAGELEDRATFFRNDLDYAEDPNVPKNPHNSMLTAITSADPLVVSIGRGIQEQIAVFFESDGTRVIHPEPSRFFEVPIRLPLPEDLGFIP